MTEQEDLHSESPVIGEWSVGRWNVRQEELGFGIVFAGEKISDEDGRILETIGFLVDSAYKLEKLFPTRKSGQLPRPLRIKKWLDGAFSENNQTDSPYKCKADE